MPLAGAHASCGMSHAACAVTGSIRSAIAGDQRQSLQRACRPFGVSSTTVRSLRTMMRTLLCSSRGPWHTDCHCTAGFPFCSLEIVDIRVLAAEVQASTHRHTCTQQCYQHCLAVNDTRLVDGCRWAAPFAGAPRVSRADWSQERTGGKSGLESEQKGESGVARG